MSTADAMTVTLAVLNFVNYTTYVKNLKLLSCRILLSNLIRKKFLLVNILIKLNLPCVMTGLPLNAPHYDPVDLLQVPSFKTLGKLTNN